MTHLVPVLRPVLGSPFRRAGLYRAAGEIPSWHIAPARTGTVTDLISGSNIITFTNSSPAWGFDSSGVLVQPTANVPFIEYDPATGACLGWRVWDVVLNNTRNNTMTGVVAGTPGSLPTNWSQFFPISGVTRTIVGTGTENGIDYLDLRLAGTPSAAGSYFLQFDTNTSAVASNGQTWTSSVFLKLASGSLAGINTVLVSTSNRNSLGNVIAAGSTSVTVTSNLRRFSNTYTNADASTAYEIGLIELQLSGAAVDITLRVGLPQLERAGSAGPVVKTSGLAASSTADVASITGAAFAGIWDQAAGTIYTEATTSVSGAPVFVPRATASAGDRIQLAFGSSGQSAVVASNVIQAIFSTSTASKRALAFAANDFALAYGSTIETDTSGTVPTVNYATIGKYDFGGNETLNGYIREMATLKSRRPNANLQAMML